ncbi:hypothetical protein ACIPZ8_01540 [Pseudomonas sp. NPDC089422]|uniref:hypothetical protein n=1 Tax=Pseudomonas sp. NPDC089422 TaxID=3364466 RepID=UPI00380B9A43
MIAFLRLVHFYMSLILIVIGLDDRNIDNRALAKRPAISSQAKIDDLLDTRLHLMYLQQKEKIRHGSVFADFRNEHRSMRNSASD